MTSRQVDGCEAHKVTASRIAGLRAIAAERMGGHVGVCQCCHGPAPLRTIQMPEAEPMQWIEFPYCKTCDEGMSYPEQVERVTGYPVAGRWADGNGGVLERRGWARVRPMVALQGEAA